MPNDHEPEIKQQWQQQPQRRDNMSLDEIRVKAREFDRKVRRWRIVGALVFVFLIMRVGVMLLLVFVFLGVGLPFAFFSAHLPSVSDRRFLWF